MKAVLILFSGDIISDDSLMASLTGVLINETTSLADKPQIVIIPDAEVVKYVVSGVATTMKMTQATFNKEEATLHEYCEALITIIGAPSTYSSLEAFKRVLVSAVANNDYLIMVPEVMKLICTDKKLSRGVQQILRAHGLQALPTMLWEINSIIKIILHENLCKRIRIKVCKD